MRKKSVLLGFIETVNFVDEKNGASLKIPILAGALNDGFDIFFAGGHGGDFDEVGIEFVGEDAGKGGFAGTWRAPKNQVDRLAFFDDLGENFAVADDRVLTDDVGDICGAHALS